VFLFRGTGGEVERVRIATVTAVPELQGPEFINGNAGTGFILHRAEKRARGRVVSMNTRIALSKVACQQRAAKDAERRGRYHQAPGRIELALVYGKAHVAHAIGVELTYKAIADSGLGTTIHADLGIGNVERATKICNVKGRVAGWDG